jgi:acetyltransferase-like isoleucine patch superfamily enzyme
MKDHMFRHLRRSLESELFMLRHRNVRLGKQTRFEGGWPMVFGVGEIVVGDAVRVRAAQVRCSLGAGRDGRLVIGSRCHLNQGVNIYASSSIEIGDDCFIGDHVTIYDTDFHPVSAGDPVRVASVSLSRNVWIGNGALILAGVRIGDSSVVAARAVVTTDVPAGCVVAGSPARVVRQFSVPPRWVRPGAQGR